MFFSAPGMFCVRLASGSQEGIDVHTSLAQNRAQRAFRHISCVVRDRDFFSGFLMTPNFVAARPGAIKSKICGVAARPRGKRILPAAPLRHGNGYSELLCSSLFVSKNRGKRVPIFKAGFHDFSG